MFAASPISSSDYAAETCLRIGRTCWKTPPTILWAYVTDWVAYTESACSHVSDIKSLASYQLLSSFSTGWAVKRDKTISLEEGGRIRSAKLARMVEPSQKSSQKECLILRDRRWVTETNGRVLETSVFFTHPFVFRYSHSLCSNVPTKLVGFCSYCHV